MSALQILNKDRSSFKLNVVQTGNNNKQMVKAHENFELFLLQPYWVGSDA